MMARANSASGCAGVRPGAPLPAFRLERLDGGHLDAAALRGRPALLIFLRHLR